MGQQLGTVESGGATIGYEVRGAGPPVALIHAGVFSAWFTPLAAEPALGGHTVVRLVRAGYGGGAPPERHISIDDHAALCAAVLDEVGLSDVHLLGHSSGSLIALALAASRPELVSSVLAVEPAPPGQPDPTFRSLVVEPVQDAVAAGDTALAFDHFMRIVCAPDYASVLRDALGTDALEAAQAESEFFFRDEVPAVLSWPFDDRVASAVTQPVLLLAGGASPPPVLETARRVAVSLPDATLDIVDGADHLWPLRDPAALAERARRFAQEVAER